MADKKQTAVKKVRYPTKTSMNLLIKEVDKGNRLSTVLPLFLVLAVIVGVFAKFAVFDRFKAVSEARVQLEAERAQLNALYEELSDFDEVRERYYRYTRYYLSDEELALVDRLDVLDIIEAQMGGRVTLTSVTISGNLAVIQVEAQTLSDLATLRVGLEAADRVTGVLVQTADKNLRNEVGQPVTASLTISLANPEEAE